MSKKAGRRMVKTEEASKGASLVIVICVAALLIAFALAMLYTAGLLLSRANERLRQERSYQLAQSFSQVLESELVRYTKTNGTGAEVAPAGSFYQYVYQFLEGVYGEYEPDNPDATIFHYTTGEIDNEAYGKIQLALYKEGMEENDESMTGSIAPDVGVDIINGVKNQSFNRRTFTVEVTATRDDISYSYRTQYRQEVTYDLTFRNAEGTVIVWNEDDSKWHVLSVNGNECSFEAGEQIDYEFHSTASDIQTCRFVKETYTEADAGLPGPGEGGNP